MVISVWMDWDALTEGGAFEFWNHDNDILVDIPK